LNKFAINKCFHHSQEAFFSVLYLLFLKINDKIAKINNK
jgi:hypothetical protein